jgi:hypothetical protein
VPTPETAAAFEKLIEARSRLHAISRQLGEAMDVTGGPANARRRELQLLWDQAFKDFESATFEFSASVKRVRDEMDALRAAGAQQHKDDL